jgi:hypothetical protein
LIALNAAECTAKAVARHQDDRQGAALGRQFEISWFVDKAGCSLENVAMADRFQNFNELAANAKVGIDFRVRIEDRGTPIVVVAPHGGWIEPVTSKIAECVAGTEFSFYAFETLKKGLHRISRAARGRS